MKSSRFEQFAIVKEDTASLFNEQLNSEVYRLRHNNPVVNFSESIPFYAHIKYTVYENTPESISDEYEAIGARFVCAQCPYFKPILKEDGTEDKRVKYGDCEHADNDYGRAIKTSPACDKLYELIREGGVKLCFTE